MNAKDDRHFARVARVIRLEEENAKLRADIKILEHDISELYLENGLLETELELFKEEMCALKKENVKLRERAEKAEASLALSYSSLLDWLSCEVLVGSKEHELSKALHVRDIEQKIKVLEDFRPEFSAENDYWGNSKMAFIDQLEKLIEQLRKELEK